VRDVIPPQFPLHYLDNLFLDGTLYRITYGFVPEGLKLTVAEQTAPMGELDMTGRAVSLLVMEGSPSIILWNPPSRVRIPVGNYTGRHVRIYDDLYEHAWKAGGRTVPPPVSIQTGQTTPIKFGAPVSAFVDTVFMSDGLLLNYRVTDARGDLYVPARAVYIEDNKPSFTAFLGGKKVCSGNFQYG
jgi:hypothetical protein